jgi:uncharacterized repeat protein (TIGR02543 family)
MKKISKIVILAFLFFGLYGCGEDSSTTLTTENTSISSDESTIDSNEAFIIEFESNGGNEIAPISKTYQETIVLPLNITKVGYSFVGWFSDIVLTESFSLTEMPNHNLTLYAKWEPVKVNVTINYYLEDLTLEGFTLVETSNITAYSGSIYEAEIEEKTGFYYNEDSIINNDSGEVLADGSLVLNLYYRRNPYVLYYVFGGGLGLETRGFVYEQPIVLRSDPIRLGYEFVGWYSDPELTVPFAYTTMPAQDIVAHAKWEALEAIVYFIAYTDEEIPALIGVTGQYFTLPEITREGYTFAGWYTYPDYLTEFTDDEIPALGIILYAKWDPIP